MFGLFRKQIHEPLAKQRADLAQFSPEDRRLILNGLDCDMVPDAIGPFGSVSNPIPVNGPLGEIKYLGKLRGRSGFALFFHRIGSSSSPVCEHSIDVYKTVCMDGTQWATLHFDMYHPRRSNLSPDGFTLMPFDERLKMDIPFAYGVNRLVSDFPHGIPDAIAKPYGESFARHAQEKLDLYEFRRPGVRECNVAPNIRSDGTCRAPVSQRVSGGHNMTMPKEVEQRLSDIYAASAKREKNLPRSISDLKTIPHESYSSLINDIATGKVTLIHAFLAWDLKVFDIFSTRVERAIIYSALTVPYLVVIAAVVLAFMLHLYLLLLSVLWIFLVPVFSSRQFPFRNLFIAASLVGTGIAVAANIPSLAALFFTYFLCHAAYAIHRRTFASVILDRAMSSELAFCFLYEAQYIDLLNPESGNYRYNR